MRFRILASAATALSLACLASPAAAQVGSTGPARETRRALPMQRATALAVRARRNSLRVALQLAEARQSGRASRARCLDSVLSQMNSTVRIIENRIGRLHAAVQRSDEPGVAHLLSVLRVTAARLDELTGEVRVCNGASTGHAFDSGRARVVVTIDPSTPGHESLQAANRPVPWAPDLPAR